jgi:hypothetical protein
MAIPWMVGVVILLALSGQDRSAQRPGVLRNSYLGKIPPEIVADEGHWLGTARPVTLAELKGKVVWLQFNF